MDRSSRTNVIVLAEKPEGNKTLVQILAVTGYKKIKICRSATDFTENIQQEDNTILFMNIMHLHPDLPFRKILEVQKRSAVIVTCAPEELIEGLEHVGQTADHCFLKNVGPGILKELMNLAFCRLDKPETYRKYSERIMQLKTQANTEIERLIRFVNYEDPEHYVNVEITNEIRMILERLQSNVRGSLSICSEEQP